MKTDQQNLKLIAAYLSGELNNQERDSLNRWVKASPDNERVFKEASKIWESSGVKLSVTHLDSNLLWKELQSRMDKAEKTGRVVLFYEKHKTVFQIAASTIILLAAVVYFLPRKSRPVSEQIAVIEEDIVFASGDKVATIYLPDSSMVWLNRKSRISYPKAFRKARRIKLEGEGYFEVRPDTTLFTVSTTNAEVQVVGTSFNIREEGQKVILTVITGIVRFSNPGNSQQLTVNANERAIRNENGVFEKLLYKDKDNSHANWRRSNSNPSFEKEKSSPKNFLSTTFKWRKHTLNRSVIEGTIKNTAGLADYTNIVLKITYQKGKDKKVTLTEKITGTVKAGGTLSYQKRLNDLFKHTRNVKVEIESATIAPSH